MKKVLITGADGMLGQDLSQVFESHNIQVVKTNRKTLDITNIEQAKEVISREKPDIVIHCAAYTNVDKAETDIETARKINAQGTENIAKACNCPMVYISTDYVFDGTSTKPYTPQDTPNPLNNYGLTKLEGEKAVQKYCKKHYIVRTSWLYGLHGKNFVETMISLAQNQELKVVNDQTGCPTWTVDLAEGIFTLLNTQKPYGIYHICGSGQATWYEFAKEIFTQYGKLTPSHRKGKFFGEEGLKPCTTEDFTRPAKRPKYSVMNNNGLCKNWKEGLKDYIKLRNGVQL